MSEKRVFELAQELNKSSGEMIELLAKCGIVVKNNLAILTKEQVEKVNSVSQKAMVSRKLHVSKDNVDQKRLDELEAFTKDYKIFIDTCSLMHDKAPIFMSTIIPLLKKHNNKIYIPQLVIDELDKHIRDNRDLERQNKAIQGKKLFLELYHNGLVDVRSEDIEVHADNVFQTVFTKFRLKYNLLLITNDFSLASEINQLNYSKASRVSNTIAVKKINMHGSLNWVRDKNEESKKEHIEIKNKGQKKIEVQPKFRNMTQNQFTKLLDKKLSVKKLPKEGDCVRSQKHIYKLVKKLSEGGEGSVYLTDQNLVCKIYREDHLTSHKFDKISLMVNKKIDYKGICWPVDLVYNEYNEFVGYVMPLAEGKELQRFYFRKPILLNTFPNWKKIDAVNLCLTILDKINYLHKHNVILGDINPLNILVKSSTEVYFVDTDSYQIEQYPCPVGTINYTAPEIQNRNFKTFLRTVGNENFAVATLIFMILLPGKPPYSQQGGEDPSLNIKNMDFAYPFEEKSTKKAPEGPWRYIWSHLTYDVKEKLYHTFRHDGTMSKENTRLNVEAWMDVLSKYKYALENNLMKDPQSYMLFPNALKMIDGIDYETCQICKKPTPSNHITDGYCHNCLSLGEELMCDDCGKSFVYTNRNKYIQKMKKPNTCKECHEQFSNRYHKFTCNACGAMYKLQQSEMDWYVNKGMDIPKKCSSCRGTRTYSQVKPTYKSTSQRATQVSTSSTVKLVKKPVKKGFCYLTTACVEYMKLPDDCYELETLREFRDLYLAKQVGGEKLIYDYYHTAPDIVEAIKKSGRFDEVFSEMYDDLVKVSVALIENGEYEQAKNHYLNYVLKLKKEFINV